MSPMLVGKQVFLLGIGAITTVMRCMTPAMTTVKKTAVGGKKSPAGAGTKTAACRSPSPALPRGGSPFLLCFRRLGGAPSLWGGSGWGFREVGEGLYALATPTELLLLVEASLRTLTRSGRATISPILTISTKRKECSLTALNTARRNSFPLGKVGMGLSFERPPLGRVGEGL